jgi:hypothetical protein
MTSQINGSAFIGSDGKHRYSLIRRWDANKPAVTFIGLNPSRADAVKNDATIIRCINFAKGFGFGMLYFANLYSFRTPYVFRNQLEAAPQIEGEKWEPLFENLSIAYNEVTDIYLRSMISNSEKVVCAWGSWNFIDERAKRVLAMIKKPYCFGINKNGKPKHPLYLSNTTQLQEL